MFIGVLCVPVLCFLFIGVLQYSVVLFMVFLFIGVLQYSMVLFMVFLAVVACRRGHPDIPARRPLHDGFSPSTHPLCRFARVPT
jgi:hypothetical protein